MNQYSPKSRKIIQQTMDQFKKGELKSGRGGKKVTDYKQAVAIGINEAREKGLKVPEE